MNKPKQLILLISLQLIFSLVAIGQSDREMKTDSLKALLHGAVGKEKFSVLMSLSKHLLFVSADQAIDYAKQSLQLAKELNNDTLVADALKQSGNGFLFSNSYDSAQFYYHRSLDKSNEISYKKGIANALSNIALIYSRLGKYEEALDYNLKSLQLEKELDNQSGVAYSLNNLGNLYFRLNDYEKALEYFQQALRTYQEIADNEGVADIFNSLGAVYRKKAMPDKALLYHQSALVIYKEMENPEGISSTFNNIGTIYNDKGNYTAALENYMKSVEYSQLMDDAWSHSNTLRNIGDAYVKQKKFQQAEQSFVLSLDVAESIDAPELKQKVFLSFSNLYEAMGRNSLALDYYRRYHKLGDSIKNSETQVRIADLELAYHLEQQEKEYDLKEQAMQLEYLTMQRARNNFYMLVVIGIVVVLLGILLLLRSRNKNKTQHLLEEKNREIASINDELKNFNDKLETKVRQRTHELEEEVKERRKVDVELKKALKNAEDANYLKNAFLANMSHEIRTPLNGIIGFSSLLETELSLMENEELYEYANGIQKSGERLLHLLNNIIDISRIEANDMDIAINPCHVNEIVKNVAELYSFKANDKGIKFNTKLNDVPVAMADEVKLTKIVSDIIDNALKYTESGFINVVTEVEKESGRVKILIKDTGIGIDQAYLDHIFEAFRQESLGYSRTYQGAGLGLPLAKRITELMNGEIKVESSKGSGTTVTILIPVAKEVKPETTRKVKPEAEIFTPEQESEDDDLKIFIVEDDRMNRLVLQKMLAKSGKSISAVDGDETMKFIEDYSQRGVVFDLMLFDINLPAPWDGIKLMKEIKKQYPQYKNVPFIAQTAYAMTGDKERLLDAGFDDYVAKPVKKAELISIIKRHVKLSKKIN